MARDLLINAPASTYGQWVRTEPPAKKTYPFRLIFSSDTAATPWSAGTVILEELVGGLPVSPLPTKNGNPGKETAGSQTGTVVQIGQFGPGQIDYEIDMPIEYVRVRTDAGIVGLVSVRLLEAD